MVECGEGAHCPSPSPPAPAPAPPPAPVTGVVEVKVMMEAVCWDTFAPGSTTDTSDRPLQLVDVQITPASGRVQSAVTNGDGIASFAAVPIGGASIHCTKGPDAVNHEAGFRPGDGWINVVAGNNPQTTVTMRRDGMGCDRKHTALPPGTPTINSMPALFWHSSFMIVIREIVWLVFLVAFIVFTIIAIVNQVMHLGISPAGAGFALPVVCLAVVAWLTHILFGIFAGVPMMIIAGLAWLAMIAVMVLAAMGLPGAPPLDYVWFPPLCGMWLSFFVMLPIRIQYRIDTDIPRDLLFAIPSVVCALVIFLCFIYVPEPNLLLDAGGVAGYLILDIVLAFVFGLIGGIAGHCFGNDGSVDPYTARTTKVKLPYAGERYCVQGNRGWFSHYAATMQERCYDFAVPEGTFVLAIEEGHIVEYDESQEGSAFDGSGNQNANFIKVQHRDGTFAHYLHLKKGGVTAAGGAHPAAGQLHVHQGQRLALAGSTGISRFPHIHLGIYDDQPGAQMRGFEFEDASVQRHGSRARTFRAYLSDNPDRGVTALAPAPPPPPAPPAPPPAPPAPPTPPAPPAGAPPGAAPGGGP